MAVRNGNYNCFLRACFQMCGRCIFLSGVRPDGGYEDAFRCILNKKIAQKSCEYYRPESFLGKTPNQIRMEVKRNMAILKDSGDRQQFNTGAVRDKTEGKGRCDLVPLDVVARLFTRDTETDLVLYYINDYIRKGDTGNLLNALRHFSAQHPKWPDMYTMILEASIQYKDGMQKYGERNWELGMPLHRYMDSGVRHYNKFLRGDKDEPHDRAFVWNILGAIWTHENKPKLIDLPFAEATTTLYTDNKKIEIRPDRFEAKQKESGFWWTCPNCGFKIDGWAGVCPDCEGGKSNKTI